MKINGEMTLVNRWIRDSRLMFLHFPPVLVHEHLYEIYSDLANKVWENRDFSEVWGKEKKKSIDPSLESIKGKITIGKVAEKYGLKVKKNMTICPFHKDTVPSLSLSDEKNVFNCFGCKAKGDIITFIRMMEDLNGNNKR